MGLSLTHTVVQNDEQFECKRTGVEQLVRPLTSDPASMSSWMTSECPASTARCSDVTEDRCPALMVASTGAPAEISCRTTPACPTCAATCSTVTSLAISQPPPRMRSAARPVTSHPAPMSSWTTWLCRRWAARKTGVTEPGPGGST